LIRINDAALSSLIRGIERQSNDAIAACEEAMQS